MSNERQADGRRVLVTGGSRGIGRAIVQRLVGDGASVIFTYRSRPGAAQNVLDAVETSPGQASAVQLDLGDAVAVLRTVSEAVRVLGGLDVLINNGAAAPASSSLAATSDAEFDRLVAANLRGPFILMREAAKSMTRGGRIINISSLSTVLPSPGIGVYAATKGGLEQLTSVAARELAPRGITVNAILPGPTDTDFLRASVPEDGVAALKAMTPMGRLTAPEDVADLVAFLSSSNSSWITGQLLRDAGGLA